jgi:hypothetical protein
MSTPEIEKLRADIALLNAENVRLANGMPANIAPAVEAIHPINHSTAFHAGVVFQAALGAEKTTWLMGQIKDGAKNLLEWAQTEDFKGWVALGLESYEAHLQSSEDSKESA